MPEAKPKIWVFFYGSYMNRKVLIEAGLDPELMVPARLAGFEIRIAPRANLVRTDSEVAYGVLAQATHEELERLYAHARHVLGETYLPEAVLAETRDGKLRAALCYLCHDMAPRDPDDAYVDRILAPARELGFPPWYLEKLASFRSSPPAG